MRAAVSHSRSASVEARDSAQTKGGIGRRGSRGLCIRQRGAVATGASTYLCGALDDGPGAAHEEEVALVAVAGPAAPHPAMELGARGRGCLLWNELPDEGNEPIRGRGRST